MNSIETFLEFYPEWRPILDPNGRHTNLSEEDSVSLAMMEQNIAEASKGLVKSLTSDQTMPSKFTTPSISAKQFCDFRLSQEAR